MPRLITGLDASPGVSGSSAGKEGSAPVAPVNEKSESRSSLQVDEQPSPFVVLPSSHFSPSPACSTLSPHGLASISQIRPTTNVAMLQLVSFHSPAAFSRWRQSPLPP